MRLKIFRAPSAGEALSEVRVELGDDALILSTVTQADGTIEMTVAMEDEDAADAVVSLLPAPDLLEDHVSDTNDDDAVRALLGWHGVPDRCFPASGTSVGTHVAESFTICPLERSEQPLLVLGGAGVGKTLSVARMATDLVVRHGVRPLVISADGKRAGALEQLASYTRILGIPLVAAHDARTVLRLIRHRRSDQPVLIDACAVDVFSDGDMALVEDIRHAAGARMVAVMAAGGDFMETFDRASAYAMSGAEGCLVNRVDQARRLGSLFAVAEAGLSLAGLGDAPGVAQGIGSIDAAGLAGILQERYHRRSELPVQRVIVPDSVSTIAKTRVARAGSTFDVLTRHMRAQQAAREMAAC